MRIAARCSLTDAGRQAPSQAFDVGRDVDRLDVPELGERLALAPGREVSRGFGIGPPRVGIADVGREELDKAPRGCWVRREERRQCLRLARAKRSLLDSSGLPLCILCHHDNVLYHARCVACT
jgi:hypothetical protein